MLGALFSKPTAIDAVAASLLALALVAPWRAGLVAAAVLVIGGGLALALELGSAGAFSLNVLFGNVNPFIIGQLWDYLGNFVLLHGVMLGLAAVALVGAARERRVDAVLLFFLTGLVMALGVGKWGAGESYFLSAIVAGSMLAGGAAGGLIRRGGLVSGLAGLLVLGQCLISAHGAVSAKIAWLPDRGLQAAALAAEPGIADLERGDGITTRLRDSRSAQPVGGSGFRPGGRSGNRRQRHPSPESVPGWPMESRQAGGRTEGQALPYRGAPRRVVPRARLGGDWRTLFSLRHRRGVRRYPADILARRVVKRGKARLWRDRRPRSERGTRLKLSI